MNISIYKKIALLFALTIISSPAVSSSTMRCGNKIIKVGDTTTQVKIICGTPFDSQSTGLTQENDTYLKIERYTYVFGKGRLSKVLEFHGGKLVKIDNGPRT
jgi:hypothetical protein